MPSQLDALRRAAACCLTFGMLVLGCTDSHPGAPNGQTHWLRECKGSAECGTLLCICGVCSAACDNGESCAAAVGEAAACKAAATASKKGQCPAAAAQTKICVAECREDAECTDRDANLHCASGICTLRNVSPSIVDGGPPATTVITARGGALDDGRTSSTPTDGGAVDAGGQTKPEDQTPRTGKSNAGKNSADKSSGGTGGTGEPTPSAGPNELTCEEGQPAHLPDGVSVIVSDFHGPDPNGGGDMDWIVSKDVLTWTVEPLDPRDGTTVKLWRQALGEGGSSSAPYAVDNEEVDICCITAYGADTLLRRLGGTDDVVRLRLLPNTGSAVNLAIEPGNQIGSLLLDADSAYWLGLNPEQDALTAWRSPRTPGDSLSLGAVPIDWTNLAARKVSVRGPLVIADTLYAASSAVGKGQMLRAAIDGSSALAAFGPELGAVDDLTTDGTDLLLMLEAERDQLDNPITSARVARMTPEGVVTEVTTIEEAGSRLAVVSDKIYWDVTQTGQTWNGTLWSTPADGSGAPVAVITTPDAAFSYGLVSNQGDLYFALACPINNHTGSQEYIMRLRR